MTFWAALLAYAEANAWNEVLVYAATLVIGALTNFIIAGYFAGKYKEKVDALSAEVLDQRKELTKLGKVVAAYTGNPNGGL